MAGDGNMGSLRGIYRKRGDIISREIAGETVLVPVRGKLADMQRIFSLNPMAAFLWGQIDGTQDLQAILSNVVSDFEVTAQCAESDIRELIMELLEAGLIEFVQ